jgi:hypothetical protein
MCMENSMVERPHQVCGHNTESRTISVPEETRNYTATEQRPRGSSDNVERHWPPNDPGAL